MTLLGDQIGLIPFSWVRPCLATQNPFLLLTFSFLLLGPPFLSYLNHNLFLNYILAYYLLALLPFGPQVVNYHFTLSSHINFRIYRFCVSHLTHETFKLCLRNTLNISKTARLNILGCYNSPPPPLLEFRPQNSYSVICMFYVRSFLFMSFTEVGV